MAHTLDGQGDRQTATGCYRQAVEIYRDLGDQWALAHPLCDLAWRTWDEGQLRKAFALIQEYLGVFRYLRSVGGIGMALEYTISMAIVMGEFETAAQVAQEKAEIERVRGLPGDQAFALFYDGQIHFAMGNLTQARRQLEMAHEIARRLNDHWFTAEILILLGRIAVRQGDPDLAVTLFEQRSQLGKEGDPRPWLDATAQLGLGQVACIRGDFMLASRLFCESLEQIQVARPEIPSRLEGLAMATLGLGDAPRAATLLGAAHHLRVSMGAPILPVDQPSTTSTLNAIRSALTAGEFRQAWAAGEGMAVEQAVTYALEA